jgi:DNA-binding response OmpR family regulator
MALDCLVICRDPHVLSVLAPAFEKLSIIAETCRDSRSGQETLASEKYDAVIVDCDDLQDGVDLLRDLKKTPSNRNSVCFAILNGKTTTKQAFELGANFVLQKPVQPVNAMRCLTAAFGQMTRERRRYCRIPVDTTVTLVFQENVSVTATATNLSEGGMAVHFTGKLPSQPLMYVQLTLPGTNNSLQPKVELAWVDGSGKAGLRFRHLPQASREHLERWLSTKIDYVETGS